MRRLLAAQKQRKSFHSAEGPVGHGRVRLAHFQVECQLHLQEADSAAAAAAAAETNGADGFEWQSQC